MYVQGYLGSRVTKSWVSLVRGPVTSIRIFWGLYWVLTCEETSVSEAGICWVLPPPSNSLFNRGNITVYIAQYTSPWPCVFGCSGFSRNPHSFLLKIRFEYISFRHISIELWDIGRCWGSVFFLFRSPPPPPPPPTRSWSISKLPQSHPKGSQNPKILHGSWKKTLDEFQFRV